MGRDELGPSLYVLDSIYARRPCAQAIPSCGDPSLTTEPPIGAVAAVGATSVVWQAFGTAEECGWAECPVTLTEALDVIGKEATVVPARPGEQPVGVIRATERADARRLSLSGQFGRGVLPLHTDGAHLPSPPDAVLLEFRQPTSCAPTLLFTPRLDEVPPAVGHALRQGIFDIGVGRAGFLTHAVSEQRVRFDPVVMAPRDALARLAKRFFGEYIDHAVEYRAPGPGTTLVIDNRRTLHGRAAVPEGISRRAGRAMIRWNR